MIVQIKNADYLWSQREVFPKVAREMLQYAGERFEIPSPLKETINYEYRGFNWKGEWLFETEPRVESSAPPREFVLQDTNFNKYIECLNDLIMPEKLQHIRLVSNHFPLNRIVPITNPTTGVTYDLRLERVVEGQRLPDPSMYIKFSGATE